MAKTRKAAEKIGGVSEKSARYRARSEKKRETAMPPAFYSPDDLTETVPSGVPPRGRGKSQHGGLRVTPSGREETTEQKFRRLVA